MNGISKKTLLGAAFAAAAVLWPGQANSQRDVYRYDRPESVSDPRERFERRDGQNPRHGHESSRFGTGRGGAHQRRNDKYDRYDRRNRFNRPARPDRYSYHPERYGPFLGMTSCRTYGSYADHLRQLDRMVDRLGLGHSDRELRVMYNILAAETRKDPCVLQALSQLEAQNRLYFEYDDEAPASLVDAVAGNSVTLIFSGRGGEFYGSYGQSSGLMRALANPHRRDRDDSYCPGAHYDFRGLCP